MRKRDPLYNILVISDYRSPGSARPEAEIFVHLAQMGHRIHVISHPSATYYNARFRSVGITVMEEHPTRKISSSFIRLLRELNRKNHFDILHAFNSRGLTNAVWGLVGTKTKLIAYRGYAGQTRWFDPSMYLKYFHPRVDHIICVSEDIRRILAANMPGSKNKLTTIPKGHDPAWFNEIIPADRASMGFKDEDILICFLANVRPFKGLTYVLQATHYLNPNIPVQFLFIGSGYDQPAIRKEMEMSPLKEQFHLLGFRSDAKEILAASDSLVLASTHGEGLSKSVVESMFLGKACIITDIPGNKGLIENGISGWVVPPKDPKALAEAINEMVGDKIERNRRGLRAQEHIRLHFHINKTVEDYLELYQRLVM